MLHIINSLYFALVTTFTVQSCTMGEWYESVICVMISIDVLSHTITVPRTAVTYSLEHKMLHIINSLYFALVTTFTVQPCTMG